MKKKTHIKRVAMLLFSYYPADPRPRREAEALTSSGISVDVICLRNVDEKSKENVNGVNVYRLPLERMRGGKFRYLYEYGAFIAFSFILLSFLHIQKRYKVIQAHNMPDILVFSAVIPKIVGSSVLLDLHDPMPEVYMAKYGMKKSHPVISTLRFLERCSIAFSDMVITPNIAFRKLFVSRSCPSKKIQVVMNSPDTAIFERKYIDRKEEWGEREPFILMYHGTIVERNGLDTLLRAVSKLNNKIPKLLLRVYGDGDFVPSFKELANELNLQDVVKYHGFVSLEVIANAIEQIDVGIIPNKRSPFTEINMPTRIFEYISMGKPVIAPNTTGIRDYFDTKTLPLFEPEDVDNLADTIFRIYSNPQLSQAFVNSGKTVYAKYTWKEQSKKFVQIVNDLI